MVSGYAKKYADAIWGRLIADNAVDLSDAEFERCLRPCVCGDMLVTTAKELREAGLLSLLPLPPY